MNEDILHLGYLTLRLSREKERKENGLQEINQRIYLLHIKGDIILDVKEDIPKNYNSRGIVESAVSVKIEEYPDWAKKIEREIVKKTHPDKLTGKSQEEIEEKTNLFLKAKEKIENKNFVDLLPIALSLGIDFSKYNEKFQKDMTKRIRNIQNEIHEIQNSIAWKWKDLSEDQKINAIDLILQQSGVQKSKEEIKNAVRKNIKRKTGTRPVASKTIRKKT